MSDVIKELEDQYEDDILKQIEEQLPSDDVVRRSNLRNARPNRENLNPKTAPKDSQDIKVKDKCEEKPRKMHFASQKIASINRIISMMIDGSDMEITSELAEKDKIIRWLDKEEFKHLRLKNGEIRGRHGISAIFAIPFEGKILRLFTGLIIQKPIYSIDGTLKKVVVDSSENYNYPDGEGYIKYEFLKRKENVQVRVLGFDAKTDKPVNNDLFEYVFEGEYTLDINYIPVQIFKNDAFARPNLYGMHDFLKTQEDILNVMPKEIYNTLTTLAINTAFYRGDTEKLKKGMDTPNRDSLLEFNYPDTGFNAAVSNLASQSKIIETITAFDKLDNLVQELAHLPKNIMAQGKNNKHNLEIAQNESQSRNNIQSKKDQQFVYYSNLFTEIILPMLKDFKIITINKKEIDQFKIEWNDSASEEVIKATTGTDKNKKPNPNQNRGEE